MVVLHKFMPRATDSGKTGKSVRSSLEQPQVIL